MRRKIYILFVIMVIGITLTTQNVMAYEEKTAQYNIISDQHLESLQKQMEEISNDYVSLEDNMCATVNVTVTKKKDENGNIDYLVGKGDKAIKWEINPAEYLFDEGEKDTWDVWLTIEYTPSENSPEGDLLHNVWVERVYLDNKNDFDPERDTWEGKKKVDGWIKKGGEIIEGAINTVGGIFNFITDTLPRIIGGIKNLKDDLQKNFVGTILTFFWDILRFIADLLQMVCNYFQTVNLGTDSDWTITYSGDYLYTDGAGKIDDDGSGNRDMYTKVGKYEKEDKKNKKEDTIYINGKKEGFTEDTPIPVIPGDLYYIALGEIELLDINFLTVDKTVHKDEKSPWMYFRNFTTAVIHITIYIGASFLIITLIVQGIRIVAHTYDNPEARAKHIEVLQGFGASLLMLIGTVIIMAISIFGSKAFLDDIKKGDSNEGPIRVNVKEAGYSFSTTVTGYFRYMTEIDDVDRYVEKSIYTFIYIVLVGVNCVAMFFMLRRMLIMLILAMVGPIIAVVNVFNRKGRMRYRTWVELYVKLALVQVFMAIIYKIILKCAV